MISKHDEMEEKNLDEAPLQVMSTKHILIFIGIMVVVLTIIALGLVFINRFLQSKFDGVRKQMRTRQHEENQKYLQELEKETSQIAIPEPPQPAPKKSVVDHAPRYPAKSALKTAKPTIKPAPPKKVRFPKKTAKPKTTILQKAVDTENIDEILKRMEIDQWLEESRINEIKANYKGKTLDEFIMFVMELEKEKTANLEEKKLDQEIISCILTDIQFVTVLLQDGIVVQEGENKIKIVDNKRLKEAYKTWISRPHPMMYIFNQVPASSSSQETTEPSRTESMESSNIPMYRIFDADAFKPAPKQEEDSSRIQEIQEESTPIEPTPVVSNTTDIID